MNKPFVRIVLYCHQGFAVIGRDFILPAFKIYNLYSPFSSICPLIQVLVPLLAATPPWNVLHGKPWKCFNSIDNSISRLNFVLFFAKTRKPSMLLFNL